MQTVFRSALPISYTLPTTQPRGRPASSLLSFSKERSDGPSLIETLDEVGD